VTRTVVRWSPRHPGQPRERLQDHVPERVLAAAQLQAARTRHTTADEATGPIPPGGVWLAVSPTRLYAFTAAGGGIGDLVEVWDRDATTVAREERLTATRVALRFGTNGAPVELDAPRWRVGQRALLRYLLDPTRTD
jgi:hypothetical protein